MSVSIQGVPASIANLIQDRTMERVLHDALFPRLLYRSESVPELWAANIGERQFFTRSGLIEPDVEPLVPGQDPQDASYATEQWSVEARQYGKSIPTHMPSSHVAIASLFLRNTQNIGIHAGQTMDRLARNRLFTAYLGGEASVTAVAAAGAQQVQVSTLNGFTEQLNNGRLDPVSPANPLPISFPGTAIAANTVIGFSPLNPLVPHGPGILTLGAAVGGAGLAVRDTVTAQTRSRRQRVGGAASIDGITGNNILTLNDVISAVAYLRSQNVPPHRDGYYHVHTESEGEAQIFRDQQWQNLHQSLPDSYAYREASIGRAVSCNWWRNTESPNEATCLNLISVPGGAGGAVVAPEIGAEVLNAAGLRIRRTIVTGGGALYEKYLDESRYITEAGVLGKIGEFSIINNGVAVMTNRIRYLLRAPLDKLGQVVNQTWSWSGDFAAPSDQLSGNTARFKRAVVIEHA